MTDTNEVECEFCDDYVDCGTCEGSGEDDSTWDERCTSCGGSGQVVPDHCCVCGGSPYCQCCRGCGASCVGECRCPVDVKLQDGGTLTLPGNGPNS